LVGILLLGEGVSLKGFGAILIGLVGVLLLSDQSDKGQTVPSQSFFWRENGRVLDKFMRPSWKTV